MRYIPPPLPGDPDSLRRRAERLRQIASDISKQRKRSRRGVEELRFPARRLRRLSREAFEGMARAAGAITDQAAVIDAYARRVEESIASYDALVAAERRRITESMRRSD